MKISPRKSQYFSDEKFHYDSLRLAEKIRGTYEVKASKQILATDRTIKNNFSEIQQITMIGAEFYKVIDDRKMNWEIRPEFSTIIGYHVQKAVTSFGGRKWIAWFCAEIPIPDGPYKFRGLPGLILKIEDSQNYHVITIKALTLDAQEFTYPESERDNLLPQLTFQKYKKKYLNFREDPVADFVGKIPDQADQYGNIKSGIQILNEFRQREIQRLKNDNNTIEIELLKN